MSYLIGLQSDHRTWKLISSEPDMLAYEADLLVKRHGFVLVQYLENIDEVYMVGVIGDFKSWVWYTTFDEASRHRDAQSRFYSSKEVFYERIRRT